MTRSRLLFLLLAGATGSLWSQPHVDQKNLHERILAVVPLTGSGTVADPIRPLFAPVNARDFQTANGIRAFTWQPTDDGKHAIVEFVAQERAALLPILRDRRVVKAFERGKYKHGDIEKELRTHKKDFDIDAFSGRKPR